MFVGHAALALAARTKTPQTSLGVLMGASFGPDLLWPLLSLGGIERFHIAPGTTAFTPILFDHYPWSHSLLMATLWGALLGYVVWRWHGRAREALVVGGLVVSHWVLDFATHRPDLPLWPGDSPLLGLGLWDSLGGTLLVEGLLLAVAVSAYVRNTHPTSRTGIVALGAFVLLIVLVWVAGPFSPPPPNPVVVAQVALAGWLLPVWAEWIDRHRDLTHGRGTASPLLS